MTWDALLNLRGPKGDTGEQGPQGAPGTTSWDGITDKPSAFTPSPHAHAQSDITGLSDALAAKANDSVALTDAAGTATLPATAAAPIASRLQALRNNVKQAFADIGNKQATLVSGTNIKTVGGQSLLGSGDVALGDFLYGTSVPTNGGGSDGDVYIQSDGKLWKKESGAWTYTGIQFAAQSVITDLADSADQAKGAALVGVTRGVSGAVGRTVRGKLMDTVSVKDFGATGDGLTDDSTAMQNAVNYLNSVGGGRLYFPRGTYITSGLTVYSNIWLVGEGRGLTTLKMKNGANNNVIYGYNADALFGSNSGGGIQNVGLFDLTVDGNRSNNPVYGDGICLYGEEFYFQNLSVTETRGHGIRTEWGRGDSLFGMESHYINVRIDRTGFDGWLNNGPHDSVTINLIVIDASLDADKTYNGITVGPNMTGRWIGCHVWNRAASHRHQWALKLAEGGGGNEFASCHFEGAWAGNVGIFCTKNLFDSTCRYYSAWNGVNVYMGGTATLNVIKGQLDSPGSGRPDSAGIVMGGDTNDWVAHNVIDVHAIDQKAGSVWFPLAGEGNYITVRGYQEASGYSSWRSIRPGDTVDIHVPGATPARVSNITQNGNISIGPRANASWTFPHPYSAAPSVIFSPVGPSGTIASGIWITSVSNTSVSFYNSSSVTTSLSIVASPGQS